MVLSQVAEGGVDLESGIAGLPSPQLLLAVAHSKTTRAPLLPTRMPARWNPHAVSSTKDVPMYTIAFHAGALPALLAGQSLRQAHSLAVAQTSSESAGATAMTLAVGVLIVAMLTAMKSVATALPEIIAALLRAIRVIVSVLFTLAAGIAIVVVLLGYQYGSWR